MAKVKPKFTVESYGIYSKWDDRAKELPKIKAFTTNIPAEVDIEFGFILHVEKGKGIKLQYCIEHPDITGEDGEILEPFIGDVYVDSNSWRFFIGDTIWEPVENKQGTWEVSMLWHNNVIATKSFVIEVDEFQTPDEYSQFISRRK